MLVFIKFLNRQSRRRSIRILHYCVLLQGVLKYYEISVETFDERFILSSHKSSIIVCSFSLGTESLPSRISTRTNAKGGVKPIGRERDEVTAH